MSLVLDTNALKSVCEYINSQNEKIVLTHGAYDLLHVGHIEFLRRSKAFCKYLIVGVDSDERVYKYKSVLRPIIPVKYRMEMLINLKFVDAVFCLEENDLSDDYFYKLYQMIKPSIITCGKPHRFSAQVANEIKNLKKANPFFKKAKVEVISHQYENIISTTDIINSILSNTKIHSA